MLTICKQKCRNYTNKTIHYSAFISKQHLLTGDFWGFKGFNVFNCYYLYSDIKYECIVLSGISQNSVRCPCFNDK